MPAIKQAQREKAGPGMRSGGDPAIPARIDRPKTARTCKPRYKNRAIIRSRPFYRFTEAALAESAVFFGICLSLSQAQSIASSSAVYYNSMSVKPRGRACGNVYDRRR